MCATACSLCCRLAGVQECLLQRHETTKQLFTSGCELHEVVLHTPPVCCCDMMNYLVISLYILCFYYVTLGTVTQDMTCSIICCIITVTSS